MWILDIAQFIEKLRLIALKKFPSNTSNAGFSFTNFTEYINISPKTLRSWLQKKSEPSPKQMNTIFNLLILKGDIDNEWNLLDNKSTKSFSENIKEHEKLRKDFEELGLKYQNISKTVPEIKDKLIEIQSNLIEATNDNVDLRLEIERLKSILDKNKIKY
jgi:hypothetical protein